VGIARHGLAADNKENTLLYLIADSGQILIWWAKPTLRLNKFFIAAGF